MIINMDEMSAPTSRELAQRLYDKNIELENRRRRSAQAKVPSDPNAWQQMRENYEAIILEDHSFSEQHNIEYALWQLHYRRIEELRAHFSAALQASQAGKAAAPRPDRITKIRLQFKTFLSESTGFYHDLILKIRAKYGLSLGNFSEDSEVRVLMEKDPKKSAEMKKGLISCHRCLIYLGDLARYKGLYGDNDSKSCDYAAASSYYLQAASLWPSSGNPHHQLAILASYSGDELGAVYRYFRSLAVDNPFSTARENLIVAFEKNRQSYAQLLADGKASIVMESPARNTTKGRRKAEAKPLYKDANAEATLAEGKAFSIRDTFKAFCIKFVRLNGILFTRTSLETFAEVLSLVSTSLVELLSFGPAEELNFGTDAVENGLAIVRIISILIFTVHNVNRESEGQTYAEILQRTVLLQSAFVAAFEFMGHIMNRCVELKDPSSSYLLPGIMVFVEWLACCPDIASGSNDMDEKQSTVRSIFWNYCISFLNKLMLNGSVSIDDEEDDTCFFDMRKYDERENDNRLALWEDFELRGFSPLVPAQGILDFSRRVDGGNKEKKARIKRILAAGKALANVVRVDQKAVYFDSKGKKFIIGTEPLDLSNDIINPLEKTMNIGVVQERPLLYAEGDEEDEVIVFKPTVTEKRTDPIGPKLTPYLGMEPGLNASPGDLQFYSTSASAPLGSNLRHRSQQPVQSHPSNWLVDQQASLVNSLAGLNILDNGHSMKQAMQENKRVYYPTSLPLPISQSLLNGHSSSLFSYQTKASEPAVPSNVHSIPSSGVIADGLAAKKLSAFPESSRKIAVSRPVRHPGPPPGFSRPKQVNESFAGSDLKSAGQITGSDLKSATQIIDNYSWLDGYQFNNSVNYSSSHANGQYISNGNGLSEAIGFPFPGKQVQLEKQQLVGGNQQLIDSMPEQFQGQSMWGGGRYFV